MRNTSGAIRQLLEADRSELYLAGLYTITLLDGSAIRWTDADKVVEFGGEVWVPGPIIMRQSLTYRMGLVSDPMRIDIGFPPDFVVDALDPVALIRQGAFNGATVRFDKGVGRSSRANISGVLRSAFIGKVKNIKSTRSRVFRFSIDPPTSELDQPFPANKYEAQCGRVLFDGACGADENAFRVSTEITNVAIQGESFTIGRTDHPGQYFALGRAKFVSGKAAGVTMHIRSSQGGVIGLLAKPPRTIAVGDKVELLPGCDRRLHTCGSKFSNVINFRGQPFIPSAESIA